MSAKKKNKKDQVHLTGPLERRIRDYSLAAAGIGAAALAPAAKADIVASAVLNTDVPVNTQFEITVGAQSVMSISNSSSTSSSSHKEIHVIFGPTERGWAIDGGGLAKEGPVALNAAIPGTLNSFAGIGAGVFSTTPGNRTWNAFIGDAKYLGFSFADGSGTHYGWVELNVHQPGGPLTHYVVTVVQWAYETTPGQVIAAGALPAPPPATPVPNSLWLMALGAAGLAGLEAMRRRKSSAV